MKTTIVPATVISLLLLLLLSPATRAQPNPNSRDSYDPYSARFSPSMAIIIVVLIAALFFMGFFSIYIRHCAAQATPGAAGAAAGIRRVTASRGLDAAVIATFPTMEYSEVKGLKIGKGALECAVCICEFEDHETLRLIPKCDHVFHPECIDMWLESHTTCPVCRSDLAAAVAEAEAAEPEAAEVRVNVEEAGPGPELTRNRTRQSSRHVKLRLLPRSHTTGHDDTERFTLRLPEEVRKEMVNRQAQLQRATSLLVLPRGGSSRRAGYRFFARILSMNSPRVAAADHGEGCSDCAVGPSVPRPPV